MRIMYVRRNDMQKTKLTVRVPQNLLDNFRRYAQEKNTTMTSLVETYLYSIPPQKILTDAPIVYRLSGILSSEISVADHKKHLEMKYGN